MSQRTLPRKTTFFAAVGLTMIVISLLIVEDFVQSVPALGKALTQESIQQGVENTMTVQQSAQQPIIVNGRAIYAVPIITGPETTAILRQVQVNDLAYVVHNFEGWGKSVSTAVSWFRCADIVQINHYRGNQMEVEAWFFLTDQMRLEVQAACAI